MRLGTGVVVLTKGGTGAGTEMETALSVDLVAGVMLALEAGLMLALEGSEFLLVDAGASMVDGSFWGTVEASTRALLA